MLSLFLGALVLGALAAPAPARAAVAHPDLSYDLGTPPAEPGLNALDLYVPDEARSRDRRPVVVYVHGGGWAVGDKSNKMRDKVALFTGAGYVFASLNYRLSPTDFDPAAPDPGRVRFPDHPDDIGEALGWLHRNLRRYGGDRRRIVLIGHSAGAHLVSLVSVDPRYLGRYGVDPLHVVATVALDTQAFDIAGRIADPGPQGPGVYYNAFGTPAENAATGAWHAGSPLSWAGPRDPRHLFVTRASAQRLPENERMAAALGQDPASVLGVPYDHEGINLAVGAADDPAGETAAIMGFIAAQLRAAKVPRVKLRSHPRRVVRTDRRRAKVGFRFRARRPAVRYQCRLDSRKFRRCASPRRLRVGRGRHRFRVRALGSRGRRGPVTAFTFRVKPPRGDR